MFKKELVLALLARAKAYISSRPEIEQRAEYLMTLSFKFHDALHLAFAEAGDADVFLTTDDRLLRKAKQNSNVIKVGVENPAIWLINTLQSEAEANEENGN